ATTGDADVAWIGGGGDLEVVRQLAATGVIDEIHARVDPRVPDAAEGRNTGSPARRVVALDVADGAGQPTFGDAVHGRAAGELQQQPARLAAARKEESTARSQGCVEVVRARQVLHRAVDLASVLLECHRGL